MVPRAIASQTEPPPMTMPTDAPSSTAPADDLPLVKRAQGGDLDAFDELVRRHQDRIYALLYNMTSSHEDTHDLAQESFVKAWQALPSFRGGSSFYTWLYRIAVNKALNFKKSPRNRPGLSLNDLAPTAESDPRLASLVSHDTPQRGAQLAELQKKLNEAMQKLSDTHRLVVTLHDIQDLSHDEIAEIMECSAGTVRSRLHYARQQLQGLLADYLK